jgi:two-component system, OmpR family, response regulator RegX3
MTRLQVPLAPADPDPERVLHVGRLEIYPAGLSLRMAGVKSTLPLREFEVLLVLAQNAGRVIPFQTLLDAAWGDGFTDSSGTLKVHVNRIRTRIRAALGVDYIRTVRGVGYPLDPELAEQRQAAPG